MAQPLSENGAPASVGEEASPGTRAAKRRRRASCGGAGRESQFPDDGYAWRQYGQKALEHTNFTRLYYRCAQRSGGCQAKKTVDCDNCDPSSLRVQYDGKHSHERPSRHREVVIYRGTAGDGAGTAAAAAAPGRGSPDARCKAMGGPGTAGSRDAACSPVSSGAAEAAGRSLAEQGPPLVRVHTPGPAVDSAGGPGSPPLSKPQAQAARGAAGRRPPTGSPTPRAACPEPCPPQQPTPATWPPLDCAACATAVLGPGGASAADCGLCFRLGGRARLGREEGGPARSRGLPPSLPGCSACLQMCHVDASTCRASLPPAGAGSSPAGPTAAPLPGDASPAGDDILGPGSGAAAVPPVPGASSMSTLMPASWATSPSLSVSSQSSLVGGLPRSGRRERAAAAAAAAAAASWKLPGSTQCPAGPGCRPSADFLGGGADGQPAFTFPHCSPHPCSLGGGVGRATPAPHPLGPSGGGEEPQQELDIPFYAPHSSGRRPGASPYAAATWQPWRGPHGAACGCCESRCNAMAPPPPGSHPLHASGLFPSPTEPCSPPHYHPGPPPHHASDHAVAAAAAAASALFRAECPLLPPPLCNAASGESSTLSLPPDGGGSGGAACHLMAAFPLESDGELSPFLLKRKAATPGESSDSGGGGGGLAGLWEASSSTISQLAPFSAGHLGGDMPGGGVLSQCLADEELEQIMSYAGTR